MTNAVAYLAIPLASAVAGLLLAIATAPGSEAALLICAVAPPLAFGLAMAAWRPLLGAWLATILGRSMLRSRGDGERFRAETISSFEAIRQAGPGRLPFTWVFVPVTAAVGLAGGLLLVLLTAGSALPTALLLAVGITGLGVVMRRLARAGRLPLPDE